MKIKLLAPTAAGNAGLLSTVALGGTAVATDYSPSTGTTRWRRIWTP